MDGVQEITAWLKERGPHELTARLPLKSFLQRTGHIDAPPEERLRQLAIALEDEATAANVPLQGWLALRRIYDKAAELSPDAWRVHESTALSAVAFDFIDQQDALERILHDGEVSARRAVELAGSSASCHHSLGLVLYAGRRPQEALEAFRKAVNLGDSSWGQLYAGHCLHDLKEWELALGAYSAVDRSAFRGSDAWRIDVLREQRAECLCETGDVATARAEVTSILDRYQAEPHVCRKACSASLWRATRLHFPDLEARLTALVETAWE